MLYALFLVYYGIFCWLITRISLFKNSGISTKWLIFLFSIHVLCGIVNCYLSLYYFSISDSLVFHNWSLEEYDLLVHHPKEFATNLFYDPYHNSFSGLLEVYMSYWNNLKTNILLKLLAVMDVFSFGNFFINTLFFNMLVFFGCVLIFKSFKDYFKGPIWILIAAVFLFPSTLVFTSLIHRDGIIYWLLAITIWKMLKGFKEGFSSGKILVLVFCIAFIFLLRNFVVFILLPALLAWVLSVKKPKYSFVIFSLLFFVCGILFFSARKFFPAADFPKFVAERQHAFMDIARESNTRLEIAPLAPDINSFLKETPYAVKNTLLLPFLFKAKGLEIPFAIELIVMELMLLILIIYPNKSNYPFIHFILFFSLVLLIMIGFTIPNLGAIIRYRSIYLNLIFLLMVCAVNWQKITYKYFSSYMS